MASDIIGALEALEKEKGIKKEYMLERITQGLIAAYRQYYRKDANAATAENVFVSIDEESGAINMAALKTIVEEVESPATEISKADAANLTKDPEIGTQVRVPVDMKGFGRIATQTAKQVIIQGIREAERILIAEEFSDKEQEVITALVTKTDPSTGNAIVELSGRRDKTESVLTSKEQIPNEVIREGDRIKVFVAEVRAAGKGPQIMLSRTHPGLVKKLFELEVPEISEGIVSVMSVAREAGSRSKIAVSSNNPDVDPIGACVGPKGGRVAAVVNELRGEKIDIIKYSDDPVQFVAEALSPADVISVQMNADNRSCTVVVPDGQLSLAIGKEGQNARLAVKLTGIKIDIKSESRMN